MEEKVKQKRLHKMHMENRNKLEMTGIVDVISFDLNKVILESDCGMITIKGVNLHVSRLSVKKENWILTVRLKAMPIPR